MRLVDRFNFWRMANPTVSPTHTTLVGWLLQAPRASFIWAAPQHLKRSFSSYPKAANRCPAIGDHESRIFEITCPFDVRLRLTSSDTDEHVIYYPAEDAASVTASKLSELLRLMPRKAWRHQNRPLLQIGTPYRFVSDQIVFLSQTSPFLNYQSHRWPGLVVGGRVPIHIWPQRLSWAFEWHDLQTDLILRRGDPWFYVQFEGPSPNHRIRMVEADLTPAVAEYLAGMDGVTDYVNQTFSLFSVAKVRRPERILIQKKR